MKPRPGYVVAILLATVALATPAVAQSKYDVRIDSNTHVRLVPRDSVAGFAEGRVVRLANDTIVLREIDALVRHAVGDLSAIEVRGGQNRARGMAYGAGAGLAIAAVGGGIELANGSIRISEFIGVLLGNTVGGGALGYFLAPSGWQRIAIAGPARR